MREWCVTLKLQNSAGAAEVSSESLRADKLPPATVHLSCAPAPSCSFSSKLAKSWIENLILVAAAEKYSSNLKLDLEKIVVKKLNQDWQFPATPSDLN